MQGGFIAMIGERLKDVRKSRNISQKKLGDIIGVQKTTISLYESDKSNPNDSVKEKIAKYFNISLDYLIGVIDDPVPFYAKDEFLRLPSNATEEEKFMLSEMLNYIEYRRNKDKQS